MLVAALVTFGIQDNRLIFEDWRDKSAYAENMNEFQKPIFLDF
jgi:hypothetical protein